MQNRQQNRTGLQNKKIIVHNMEQSDDEEWEGDRRAQDIFGTANRGDLQMPNRLGNILDEDEDDLSDQILTQVSNNQVPHQQHHHQQDLAIRNITDPESVLSAAISPAGEIKGRKLYGKVWKLSNYGYSQHQRLLMLNKKGISYYREVPQDFNEQQMTSVELRNMNPKRSIPISKIIQIEKISDQDRKLHKKFYKDPSVAVFKIIFERKAVEDGRLSGQLTETSDEDENKQIPEIMINEDKPTTWYFSMETTQAQRSFQGPSVRDWLINTSLYCSKANKKFKPSPSVQHEIDLEKVKIKKVSGDLSPQLEQKKHSNKKEALNQRSQNFTTENPDQNEIDEAINSQFNISKKKDDERTLLKRMNGITNPDNDRKGNKAMGNEIPKEMIKEYKEKFSAVHEHFTKYENELSAKDHQGWDLKFQNYVSYLIKAQGDFKRNFLLSEKLIDHVGQFREESAKIVKSIVDELDQEMFKRKIKPLSETEIMTDFQLFYDEELELDPQIYYNPSLTSNIIIKLTHQGDVIKGYSDNDRSMIWEGNTTMNKGMDAASTVNSHHGDYEETTQDHLQVKQFGRQLLSCDLLFDCLFFNSKQDGGSKLRVPLTCMVDYKGFRALCTAHIQIQQELGPQLGFVASAAAEPTYISKDNLKQELSYVGILLNLKDNRTKSLNYQQPFERVPVSNTIQVCLHQPKEDSTQKKEEDPHTKEWFDWHDKELEYLEEPNYILKNSEIFPSDIINDKEQHPDRCLRPELVVEAINPLSADICKSMPRYVRGYLGEEHSQSLYQKKPSKNDNNAQKVNKKDEKAESVSLLNEHHRYLKEEKIPQLIDLLDSLIVVPIDSETLQEAFHVQGVNMRYLGAVAQNTTLPHIRDICYTEMFARTLKRLFNTNISGLIRKHQERNDLNREQVKKLKHQEANIINPDYQNTITIGQTSGKGGDLGFLKRENLERQQQEIKERLDEVRKEREELDFSSEKRSEMWLLDFLNMVFGAGPVSQDFWSEVVIPETAIYYTEGQYGDATKQQDVLRKTIKDLQNHDRRLNALYFALIELMNIKVSKKVNKPVQEEEKKSNNFMRKSAFNETSLSTQKNKRSQQNEPEAKPFHNGFGRDENPFGDIRDLNSIKYHFELIPKTKTFKFRNLPYQRMAQKFNEYQNNGWIEEAIETCRMRSHINLKLKGDSDDLTTQSDLCQIYLERKQFELATTYAAKAIKEPWTMHAHAIKFQCILMQAFYMSDQTRESDVAFTRALSILDHHWGPFHPLHINIYGIMAQLLIRKEKYEDATHLYKASLRCCMRILGPNHIQTGEVHMDYARLQLLKGKKDDSLQHFIEAQLIYKNYFGTEALQTAEASMQIANLLEEDMRLKKAYEYAKIASATYQNVYAEDNQLIIKAMWQELSIAYALFEKDVTLALANQLFFSLAKRDQIISVDEVASRNKGIKEQNDIVDDLNNDLNQSEEELKKEIDKIKAHVIATIIMEITRRLQEEDKHKLQAFCDKMLFYKKKQEVQEKWEQIIPNLKDYHHTNYNPQRVASVQNLEFSREHQERLLDLYNQTTAQFNWSKEETTENKKINMRAFEVYYDGQLKSVYERQDKFNKDIRVSQGTGADSDIANEEVITREFEASQDYFLQEINHQESPNQFFLKLIQTFDKINFYNLIFFKGENFT